MSYIKIDKKKLINLEYALSKELVRSNRAGAYASTTIIGCNTRKYHGLLVVPQAQIDNELHVLLSTLDVSVVQHDAEFNLGIHKYPGTYHPKGHKYIDDFIAEPIPKLTYRVGGVVLFVERLLSKDEDQILVRYTVAEANSPVTLKFRPFLAFRNRHSLSKANIDVNKKYENIQNGIKLRMYDAYSHLHLQFSKEAEYIHFPDWFYNTEYIREMERGYDYCEDLYVPGYFELPMKKGESVVFSASIKEENPVSLKSAFTKQIKKRIPRNSFENCLLNSAQQFIVRRDKKTEIIAGFPWFGRWGRDTFISLPGLTLETGDAELCKSVIDTMIADLDGPLFPNIGSGSNAAYNSVDAPLWFFWALQKYAMHTNSHDKIWKEYGKKMKIVLEGFRKGTSFNIKMQDNGLIYAGEKGKALTWMDAVVNGKPITPRIGMPVEINALWYNAIMFSIEVARLAKDEEFVKDWETISEIVPASFKDVFWNEEKSCLFDYINDGYKDDSIRPNQIFACSLPYSVIPAALQGKILEVVKNDLLTPRGLRTLSPEHKDYEMFYQGDQRSRDEAYHQGTVWPWLLGHFAEAWLNLYGKNGIDLITDIYTGLEEHIMEHGIGTISEVFSSNPPHKPDGTISQAWSVAELIRIGNMIKKYDKEI